MLDNHQNNIREIICSKKTGLGIEPNFRQEKVDCALGAVFQHNILINSNRLNVDATLSSRNNSTAKKKLPTNKENVLSSVGIAMRSMEMELTYSILLKKRKQIKGIHF